MVVDRLENIEKYASLNPLFAQAIESSRHVCRRRLLFWLCSWYSSAS